MKKLLAVLAVIIMMVVAVSPLIALAADVTNAEWRSKITVSNNGTAVEDVPGTFTLSTEGMIDADMLGANATDATMRTASGTDIPFMPSANSTYPWCTWIPSIDASASLYQYLYSGEVTGGLVRYFPGDAGMTTPDSLSMELGNNFTITQSGWIDTDAGDDKNLVNKAETFRVYVSPSVSENITAGISYGVATSATLITNAAGDETGDFTVAGPPQWEAVQTDDDNTSYISTANATYQESSFNLSPFVPTSGNISSVNVTFEIRMQGGGTGKATPKLRLDGVNSYGDEESKADQAFERFTQTITRPGGGSWVDSDLADLQVGIKLKGTGTEALACTYLAVIVNYTPEISVSATGVTSGEKIVEVIGKQMIDECVGGTAIGSTGFPANAFDNDFTTRWHATFAADPLPQWVVYDFGAGNSRVVARYSVAGRSDIPTHSPRDWNFQGSNDASDWDTLDTQVNINFAAFVIQTFEISNTEKYRYYRLYITDSNSATATSVSKFRMKEPSLRIEVDDVVKDTYTTANITVPDTANNWAFLQNNVMPYMGYHTISVNSTQVQHIVWEYDTTFYDTSGFDNDATPTFRAASTANITGEVVAHDSLFETENPAVAPTAGFEPEMEAPEPPGLYTEGGTDFPWSNLIIDLAGHWRVPIEVISIPVALLSAMVMGLLAFGMTHSAKMGVRGSLWVQCMVTGGVMILWYIGGGGVLPGWILIPFGLWATVMLIWRNPFNPAG